MDGELARRNLRDFLSMYNQFTETCFDRCIQNLNYRVLTPDEESCTSKCVSKLINVNHRQISVYMEINPLNRRLNEMGSGTNPEELQNPAPDIAKEVEKALGTTQDSGHIPEATSDSAAVVAGSVTTASDNAAAAAAVVVMNELGSSDVSQVAELPSQAMDTATAEPEKT